MIFGNVDNLSEVNFELPPDHKDTEKVLKQAGKNGKPEVYVGCAKWNRTELKGFYPKGIRDELAYYASQFNSIELNASFYGTPRVEQVTAWHRKTPDDFKFFPKITRTISHFKRLRDVKYLADEFCLHISNFESKLGMVFLQLNDNFTYKDFKYLKEFVTSFPVGIPLAVELRNQSWFDDEKISSELYAFLEENNVTNIIVDTAGRRDMLHMRLTTPSAFIRYVGANHSSDYTRLDEWVTRIEDWVENGLENLYFFVHQNIEEESPKLAAHFIQNLNEKLGFSVRGPHLNGKLF
ncbi:DUF72 domain-containing protein [Maribellus sp. YY47]|uniref:DUF72 domain-containing protein n=1 Tax=Maribellus sp. YY47 TaxID=2929486 RepID=UPI002001A336|nr:DUF72 domain-containing protein [Maribellus sp. YY47]MCK3683529.1 DUF72 domain-containing protein [Maribellus sp. YY47]